MKTSVIGSASDGRKFHVFDDVDPTRFVSMNDAMSVLKPHLPALIQSGEIRQNAGEASEKIVASLASVQGPAARIYAAQREDRNAADDLVVLFAPGTGRLDAIFVGPQIGRWRVAVLSALALNRMGIAPSKPVCLLGTGGQAAMHVHALAPLAPGSIRVVGRDKERTSRFCDLMAEKTSQRLIPMTDVRAALQDCAVVVTATSSDNALFEEADVSENAAFAHVGPKSRNASEIPAALYKTASALLTDCPAELANRFSDSVLQAGGRQIDDVYPLSDERPIAMTGRRIYVSLGVPGAETVLSRLLLERITSQS